MLHKLIAMRDELLSEAEDAEARFKDKILAIVKSNAARRLDALIQEYEGWVCVPREAAEKYNELLYAVATKHPGESRHETALRYIRQAETSSNNCQAAAKEEE